MQRQKINGSSQIVSVGYDASSMVLEIEFSSTGVYQYDGVPATVYEEFLRADSKGNYFAVWIRACYPFRRMHTSECLVGVVDNDCGAVGCGCWCHKPKKEKKADADQSEKGKDAPTRHRAKGSKAQKA